MFKAIGAKLGRVKRKIADFFLDASAKRHKKLIESGKVTNRSLSRRNKHKSRFVVLMLAFPIAQFLLFYVYVNFNSIIMAFQRMNVATGKFEFYGFQNFAKVVSDLVGDKFLVHTFTNSLMMFAAGLFISIPLSLIFSYFVYKKLPGAKIFRFVLFLPSIISSVILCLVFKMFVNDALPPILKFFGAQNPPNLLTDKRYAFGTIIFYNVWMGFATGLILYSGAMARIPEEIVESAKLDGITRMREMVSITIPMIFPTISTMLVLSVAGLFTNMGPIYAIYGDLAPSHIYTLGYYMYYIVIGRNASLAGFPYAAAMGLVFTLIVAPITLLVKYLLEKFGPTTEY